MILVLDNQEHLTAPNLPRSNCKILLIILKLIVS